MRHTMRSTTRVSPWFVSSSTGTRHVQEWDRSPFSSESEGAIQRLLRQFHLMSSVSEENSFRLAQDKACLSSLHSSSSTGGSRLTIRNPAADSAANGQTSKESGLLALQVKERRPASCVVNTSSCCFQQRDEGRVCGPALPCCPCLCVPGEVLVLTGRPQPHALLLPGGGGPAVHRAAPEVRCPHPPDERKHLEDPVQAASKAPGSCQNFLAPPGPVAAFGDLADQSPAEPPPVSALTF